MFWRLNRHLLIFIITAVFMVCVFVEGKSVNQFGGKIYYVSVDGSDGNSGTKVKPFATIGRAVGVELKSIIFYAHQD